VKAVRRVVGRGMPLDRANVDTDQIIPAHWLRSVERTGYGPALFEAWRKDPAFVLNDPRYRGAQVLIAGPNFASGSSREHAAWALLENGFAAVIAPSFADIFRSNSAKNGLLAVELPAADVERLMRAVERDPATEIAIDVEERTVVGDGVAAGFPLDDDVRRRLLDGLDDIAITLTFEDEIARYETERPAWSPRVA
jgi:3-isopropylmalate/(R)-2-methylmalate dehydratase small subunit